MRTFQPGEQVAFAIGDTWHLGTVSEPNETGTSYIIDACDGSSWVADTGRIGRIRSGVPLRHIGDRVQVDASVPGYAGRAGTVTEPAIYSGVLGYWLRLDPTCEPAWIPAEALIPPAANGNGGEPR